MTTAVTMNFPGPLGSKRRRMRSGGNASANLSNNNNNNSNNNNSDDAPPSPSPEENVSEQKTTQTSKCKGATSIPIFLKKTYKMVDTCDQSIASWTEEGDMFVVKDPDLFATQVIPQYFDHNKFSSFARQLNFYGFRKMQSKPIRNIDFDAGTAKHVTFFNENFKRSRCDLLKKIQRSTRGGGATTPGDQSREVVALREQVANLEQQISEVATQTEERVRRLELEMLSRMEQMMLAVQQQQRTQLQLEKASSIGTMNSGISQPSPQQLAQAQAAAVSWDHGPFAYTPRNSSVSSAVNSVANAVGNQVQFQMPPDMKIPAPPTLPPHPKQKQLPLGSLPDGGMGAPPDRMNSLRGISTLSRGMSGLTRGASVESSASAVLMRNSWEDKFFSMMMLDGVEQGLNDVNFSPNPIVDGAPMTVSESSMDVQQAAAANKSRLHQLPEQDDLSDVSSSDLP